MNDNQPHDQMPDTKVVKFHNEEAIGSLRFLGYLHTGILQVYLTCESSSHAASSPSQWDMTRGRIGKLGRNKNR